MHVKQPHVKCIIQAIDTKVNIKAITIRLHYINFIPRNHLPYIQYPMISTNNIKPWGRWRF